MNAKDRHRRKSVTDREVEIFMAECDAGLHPITEADKRALEKSKPKLMAKVKRILGA